MHTYLKAKDQDLWTVGYYVIDNDSRGNHSHCWVALSDHSTESDAVQRVNYLNGGDGFRQGHGATQR